MARLHWTTVEEDEGLSATSSQSTAKLTRPARRQPLRPRESSPPSDSDLEASKDDPMPRTPANAHRQAKQVRLVHLNSLKKFSQSPAKSTGEVMMERKAVRIPRREGSLTVREPADSLRIHDPDTDGGEGGSDACRSRNERPRLATKPRTSRDTDCRPTIPSPPVDTGEICSLLELSNNLQSMKIIDDGQDGRDVASIPETRPTTSSDKENNDAVIHFSPTGSKRPAKKIVRDRPVTPPPASPTKSRLQSPSKKATRIPTPPGRPSLDNFWDAQDVNAWNDQHSPQKPLQSPRKRAAPERHPPFPDPQKPDQADRAAKKLFATTRHALATAFLAELDQTITAGQIHALSASTGGVRLVWSPTLTTTAGRASWRREREPPPPANPSEPHAPAAAPQATARHFATIELATKVIDSPSRLHNTLAHEFCHLANFMISGVRDRPHGASFRAWGRRVSEAFAHRGVDVTTRHSFRIEYKYAWACAGGGGAGEGGGEGDGGCGTEYQRHSKSIDPRRQRCGKCRGGLVQVRPVPREGVRGYAAFVKENFGEVRSGLPAGSSHKMVMEALGERYRARMREGKEGGLGPPGRLGAGSGEGDGDPTAGDDEEGVEGVVRALEVAVLSSDDEGGGDGV